MPSGVAALHITLLRTAPVTLQPGQGYPSGGGYVYLDITISNSGSAPVAVNAEQNFGSGDSTFSFGGVDSPGSSVPPDPSLFPLPAGVTFSTLNNMQYTITIPAHGSLTGWISVIYTASTGQALYLLASRLTPPVQALPFTP